MSRLEQDPEFQERKRQREALTRARAERYEAAAAPVVAALAAAGYGVRDIGDLVKSGAHYSSAVPVLVDWLSRADEPMVQDAIARALSVPWAKEAGPALVREFRRVSDDSGTGVRWTLGNALSVVASDPLCEDLIELATDRRFGRAREMVVLALGNMSASLAPRVRDVLVGLLADDEVAGHALIALGKLADPETRDAIEPFTNHGKPWVRTEAKKALLRIDRKERARGRP
jgi:HEAT repeat protein